MSTQNIHFLEEIRKTCGYIVYFSMKICVEDTHQKCLAEVLLMSNTTYEYSCGDIRKKKIG